MGTGLPPHGQVRAQLAQGQALIEQGVAQDLFPDLAQQLYSVEGTRCTLLCDGLNGQRGVHRCVSFSWWQATHSPAHGSEGPQVLLQTLVCLLVQPSHGSELGPVETAQVWVKHHTKGRHHTVKISFLSPRPSLLAFYLGGHLGVDSVVEGGWQGTQ